MAEIKSYPELVDAIWTIVQGTYEHRERVDFMFSEAQVAKLLGVPWAWESDACVFGVAQAINDLVYMGYCKGRGSFNGHRWMNVSPSADCPDVPPSASLITPPLPKIPLLRRKALQLIHEHTVRHEDGIKFYIIAQMLHQEAISALFPTTSEIEIYKVTGEMIQAMSSLETGGFVTGIITSGALILQVIFKGACWLLIAQPLLKLEERACSTTCKPRSFRSFKDSDKCI